MTVADRCDFRGVALHPGDVVVTGVAPGGYGTGCVAVGVVSDRMAAPRSKGFDRVRVVLIGDLCCVVLRCRDVSIPGVLSVGDTVVVTDLSGGFPGYDARDGVPLVCTVWCVVERDPGGYTVVSVGSVLNGSGMVSPSIVHCPLCCSVSYCCLGKCSVSLDAMWYPGGCRVVRFWFEGVF